MILKTGLALTAVLLFNSMLSAADGEYISLQIGNSWKYNWTYDVPPDCQGMACFIDGGNTIATVIKTIVRNQKSFFILETRANYSLLGDTIRDTVRTEWDLTYKYNVSGDKLWRDFAVPSNAFLYQPLPQETQRVMATGFVFPPLSCAYTVLCSKTYQTIPFLSGHLTDTLYYVQCTDTCKQYGCTPAWSEYYARGIGLVFRKATLPNGCGFQWYCNLVSAQINGKTVAVHDRNLGKDQKSADALKRQLPQTTCFYTISGRRIVSGQTKRLPKTIRSLIVVDSRGKILISR
jgi:hypothetical protein